MGQCSDLKGSMTKSVILGIRLGADVVGSREEIAKKTLEDEKVKKAIHEAFKKEAANLAKASLTGESMGADQAMKVIGPIAKAAKPSAQKAVEQQQSYKDAKAGLKNLKCAFDKTPVGVFIDKNETWLIIAGVVVAAAGAVLMYHYESGDLPAKGLTALAELKAKKIELGAVTFSATKLHFKPTNREVKGTLGVSMGDLKTVKTKFNVKVALEANTLKELKVSEQVIIPLDGKKTSLVGTAGAGVKDSKAVYDLALGVKHKSGALVLEVQAYYKGEGAATAVGGTGKAGYQVPTDKIFGKQSTMTLGVMGNIESKSAGGGQPHQTAGAITMGATITAF